jgi:oxygen-independent coproporphyrinogen-3 oxidase
VTAVFAALRGQITQWAARGLDGSLGTIYVGGGTPSLHPGQVVRVLDHVRALLPVDADAEITVEGNPDSLSVDTVKRLAGAGVTRVSVGVQSFDDRMLRLLGRRHDAADAMRACRAVTEERLDLSVDLICGIPGQTMTSWSETLERAASTGAYHASVYPLSIEDGTAMQVAVSAGLVNEPDPEQAADMMVLAEESLGYHALGRYEVANYAEDEAHQSRHNSAYWLGRSYIGIGPAAHGMLDVATAKATGMVSPEVASDVARVRYGNAAAIDEWMVGRGDELELLTAIEAAREDAMLGLRLVRGITVDSAQRAGVTHVLHELADTGLVMEADGRWKTTRKGWLLGNEVSGRVWAGE